MFLELSLYICLLTRQLTPMSIFYLSLNVKGQYNLLGQHHSSCSWEFNVLANLGLHVVTAELEA